MSRVGIFSGTFDPVHGGHIALALESIQVAGLDGVYFMPEAQPRRKEAVTHYAHRIAMLRLALKPYQKLVLLELPDKQFSVSKTWPRLKKMFPNDEIMMLIGSDMLSLLCSEDAAKEWPGYQSFIESVSLIVSVRSGAELATATKQLQKLQPDAVAFASQKPHASSSDIRRMLMYGKSHPDVLPSIKTYISKNWLYTSPAALPPKSS